MLRSLFSKKRVDPKIEMMNEGIELALAFGKNWKVSTQQRFSKKYPSLSEDELNHYNQQFISALKYAHDTVLVLATSFEEHNHLDKFKEIYTAKYDWVNEENLKRLYRQGMYYFEKDRFERKQRENEQG